jgi:Family of unknown function (DUF6011)
MGAVINWRAEHADVIQWIEQFKERNSFASSLYGSLMRFGTLTVPQVVAVRKSLGTVPSANLPAVAHAGDAERLYREHAQSSAYAAQGIDLKALPAGRYAVPGGDTRLKVLVRHIPPDDPDKWAGYTFVSDAAEYGRRKRYGMQRPGKLYTGEIQAELRAIMADPKAATVAYGKLTSQCGICGRPLEDEESVARGIGPICAGKRGWL